MIKTLASPASGCRTALGLFPPTAAIILLLLAGCCTGSHLADHLAVHTETPLQFNALVQAPVSSSISSSHSIASSTTPASSAHPPSSTALSPIVNECARTPSVCQNGATCISKPAGGHQCICVNGWAGDDCSENVDDCINAACEAGATCHDHVGHFSCQCPPGKTGLFCQHDDGCYKNPCHANATCDTSPVDGHAICTCLPGFTGLDCSIDVDECAAGSPCEHGGFCVNQPGSFRCQCLQGFTGTRCEININECDNNPCMNEGTCLDEKGGYRCICPPGFAGQQCQIDIDECSSNPCQNGGLCKDELNSFKCLCPDGYYGSQCEYPLLADGNPWAKCANPLACWRSFRNGKCDQECYTAECLYDGDDCAPPQLDTKSSTSKTCGDKSDSYCLKNYANKACDLECNTAECGWDGGDCERSVNPGGMPVSTQAQGLLVIRVEPAIDIATNGSDIRMSQVLRTISVATKTILTIQSIRDVNEGRGTEIELIADNRYCRASCYNSTELIARFLSALRARDNKAFPGDAGALKVTDIQSRNETQGPVATPLPLMWAMGALCVVCCVGIMVVSIGNRQKVKEKATVWFPEGFNPVLSSRNRDPTNRKPGRNVSTLQALGGNFFRGLKRNERKISTNPNGLNSTDIDQCSNNDGSGIYHEPYDQYDQYGTYNGTDSGSVMNNIDEPMSPSSISVNPINMEGPHGLTPLMVASMGPPLSKEPLGLVAYGTTGEVNGPTDSHVTDLLQRGAQISLANSITGETALHMAARLSRVDNARALLERCDSQDVNAQDATGRTPLHAAIAADSLGVFELLIRCRGTDLNAQTNDGTTPLILAARVGTYSMLEELILNECEVTKSDANGKTALHWAAATNNVDAVRRLLAVRETNKDAQDLAEETPLFLASREGAKGAVETLLSHNANKDICDHMDRSPIQIARSRHHYDIVRLLEDHESTTPRSVNGVQSSNRQLSPFSPDSNSNSSSLPPPPSYHLHSQSGGRQGGRQAQKAALARSNSTKPLIADASMIRNNLQSHCKSVMTIKSEDRDNSECQEDARESRTLGRRATQSTSSSHHAIQPNMHGNHFGALSANNVVMPATPNSLTNSLSPVSTSMMSPPTHSLHHLNSPTKSNPPVNFNQLHRQHNGHMNQVPPSLPTYDECQTFWTNNNNNNNPHLVNVNNNVMGKTHGIPEVYNVPCLKNYMTPSPDSPFSLESMASPPGTNYNDQQYQNPNHPGLNSHSQQDGVFI